MLGGAKMTKVVTVLQPFTLQQNVYVYEDGNKLEAITVDTVNVQDTIASLVKEYAAAEINFGGPVKYAKGIGKKVQEILLKNFSIDNIKINYLT